MTKKDAKIFRGAVLTLIIVIVVSMIYAVLTKRISINREGNSSSSGYAWKISFQNLSEVTLTGTAQEITKPSIVRNATKIGDYDVLLINPGDSISYTFDVVNEGMFNAIISSVLIPKPICYGRNIKDAANVCRHIKYSLNYVETGNSLYNLGRNINIGDTLYKGQSRKMKLTLSYDSGVLASELATSNVKIGNLGITIIYSQCDKKCNVRGYNAPN